MSYRQKTIVQALWLVILLSLPAACSQTTTSEEDNASSPTGNSSTSEDDFDANINLTFNIDILLEAEDDATTLEISLNDDYTLPLHLDSNGDLTVRAKDMPTMIYRVCATGTTQTGCDTYSDLTSGLNADLVIDSCGRLVDNADCGTSDDTTFSGSISDDGSMIINDLSIRIRAFLVTSTSSGSAADDGDAGLLTFHRMVMDLTTTTVSTNDFTQTGSSITNKTVTLVATATVATTSTDFESADFIATLTGTFDVDPLGMID